MAATPEAEAVRRAKISETTRAQWTNPETREKLSAGLRAGWDDPERREKQSEGQRGPANWGWKGGRSISDGYIRVAVGAGHHRWEHRIVMEQMIGRPLKRGEVVHHINGVRDDNRPENLQLFASQSAHRKHHAEMDHAALKAA